MKIEDHKLNSIDKEGSLKKRLLVKTEFVDGFDRIKLEESSHKKSNANYDINENEAHRQGRDHLNQRDGYQSEKMTMLGKRLR